VAMTADKTPRKVIAWLKTPAGERWSERRLGSALEIHFDDSGVFASVLHDGSAGAGASWPDPGEWHDLGNE
jgi:hypothetical protein